MQLGTATVAVGNVLALMATPDPAAQRVERSVALVLLLTFSLRWASKPLRGALRNGLADYGLGAAVHFPDPTARN